MLFSKNAVYSMSNYELHYEMTETPFFQQPLKVRVTSRSGDQRYWAGLKPALCFDDGVGPLVEETECDILKGAGCCTFGGTA